MHIGAPHRSSEPKMSENQRSVQATLVRMVRAYPSLYRTRAMALAHIFDSSTARWIDGNLVETWEGYDDRLAREYLPFPSTGEDGNRTVLSLRELQENAKAQFVHDHAEMIASTNERPFEAFQTIDFRGKHFDSMPIEAASDWKQAAIDLAWAIKTHKPVPRPSYTLDAQKVAADRHAASQAVCQHFLERVRVSVPCPYARAQRVAKLLQEARALGMVLTEQDGSEPKTSV